MDRLPMDVVRHILVYDGRIKYHMGKYVNIIHKSDARYQLVSKIIERKKLIIRNNIVHDINCYTFYISLNSTYNKLVGLLYVVSDRSPYIMIRHLSSYIDDPNSTIRITTEV